MYAGLFSKRERKMICHRKGNDNHEVRNNLFEPYALREACTGSKGGFFKTYLIIEQEEIS